MRSVAGSRRVVLSTSRGTPTRIGALDMTAFAIAGLTVFAFVLRFLQIHQSLFGDEVWTYQDVYGRSLRGVLDNVHAGGENSPPLFFLFAYATAKLGDPTVWIRLSSIVLGAATIPVVYLVARQTVGRVAGLVGAAVIAFSPFSFFYGVEARPYASMAFFVAVSTLALLHAVRTDRTRWWATYALAAAAAAYCHYTSVFVLAVQGAWSLWVCRDRLRGPLISAAVAVVLYLPWVPKLRGKELAVIGALHPLTAHNVINDLPRPIAGDPNAPLAAIPTTAGLIAIAVCVLVGAVSFARAGRRAPRTFGGERSSVPPRRLGLLIALMAATPVGLLLYSLAATDLWLPRGLYASVPAAALVLGALLTAIPRPLDLACVAVVIGVLLFGTIRDASPSWRRPPMRALAAHLDRIAPSRDPMSIISALGQPALIAQFHHYHHDVSLASLWRDTPAGGQAYVVEDLNEARLAHRPPIPAAPNGFALVGRRRYRSSVLPLELLTYRRTGAHR